MFTNIKMLNVNKINDEKKRVNQRLTKDGMRKQNVPAIIEAVALTLDPKAYQDESSTIDQQLSKMDREKREKKLMQYQLKNNPQTVSNFLVNKYSDGNFNKAGLDRYDNSEERKKLGITFDYHVYFKPEKEFNDRRANNKYVMSETIIDRTVGDNYTYHIPVWIDTTGEVPIFMTDYGEIVNDPASRGLLWSLKQLRDAIESRSFSVPPEADDILSQWGFIKNGRIVHDLKHGFMVEKYLKSIGNEDKKENAIKYLDTMVKALAEDDDLGDWIGDGDLNVDEPEQQIPEPEVVEEQKPEIEEQPQEEVVQEEVVEVTDPPVEISNIPEGETDEQKLAREKLEEEAKAKKLEELLKKQKEKEAALLKKQEEEAKALEKKREEEAEALKKKEEEEAKIREANRPPTAEESATGFQITPTSKKTTSTLYQLAVASRVPTVTYTQLTKGTANDVRTEIYVPLEGKLYVIRLRTGTQKLKLNIITSDLGQYKNGLKRWLEKGWIIPTAIPQNVVDLLKAKGFGDLIDGKHPKDMIPGFERAIRK